MSRSGTTTKEPDTACTNDSYASNVPNNWNRLKHRPDGRLCRPQFAAAVARPRQRASWPPSRGTSSAGATWPTSRSPASPPRPLSSGVALPVSREVLKVMFWKAPMAGWRQMWLANAQSEPLELQPTPGYPVLFPRTRSLCASLGLASTINSFEVNLRLHSPTLLCPCLESRPIQISKQLGSGFILWPGLSRLNCCSKP